MSEKRQETQAALPRLSEDRQGPRAPGEHVSHLFLVSLKATGSQILMNF